MASVALFICIVVLMSWLCHSSNCDS